MEQANRFKVSESEAINIYYSLIEEYRGLPFRPALPADESKEQTMKMARPEMLKYLKASIRKNYRLGQLLSRRVNTRRQKI